MLGEIFVVGATAVVTQKILGFLFNNDNENQVQNEEELPDVQIIGSVLPEEPEPVFPVPPAMLRQPGEPLWQNHRLYERSFLPRQPRTTNYMGSLPEGISTYQREPNIDVRNLVEQMMSNTRFQQQELEDPFSNGTQRGWVYHNGQRSQR